MYKAEQEIRTEHKVYVKGKEIPEEFVTERMKELGMVRFYQDEVKVVEKVEKSEKPKKRKKSKKKKEELLTDDSSSVQVENEDLIDELVQAETECIEELEKLEDSE